MQSDEYGEGYFKETRNNVGLLLKTMRPMWWRWVRILRGNKRTGRLLDDYLKKGGTDAHSNNQP